MDKRLSTILMCGLFLTFLCFSAHASTVRSAVGVTENTFGEYGTSYGIENVSNQSGLLTGFTSGVTDWDTYFGNPIHQMNATAEWWGDNQSGLTGQITFDLGDVFYLDKIALWNEDANGIESFDLYVSTNGTDFSLMGTGFTPTDHAYSVNYGADIFDITRTLAQFVKLDILAAGDTGYSTASMGEIAFSTDSEAPPVPEPATFLLLGSGLAGLAFYRRKRK